MKKIPDLFLAAIIIVISCGACQATPDKSIVVQKDMQQMVDKAQSSSTANCEQNESLAAKLGIPNKLSMSLKDSHGQLTVKVDAAFILPDTDKLPTAMVSMDTFSQEMASKIISVLLHGETLYDTSSAWEETKSDIQKHLVELYAMRDGKIPVNTDSGNLKEDIKLYEQRLAKAPETVELIPASTSFKITDEPPYKPYQQIEGAMKINGKPAYLRIKNQKETNDIEVVFINRDDTGAMTQYDHWSEVPDKERKLVDNSFTKPSITSEQAKQKADQIIAQLGLTDMRNSTVEQAVDMQKKKFAFVVSYSRVVNNVPITLTADSGSSPEVETGQAGYIAGWRYERIDIVEDDTGVIEFSWVSPYTDPKIVTENTNLYSFSDIQHVFEKMILAKKSWNDEDNTLELNIEKVQLGLMRITDPNQRNSGILIPVWDFIGTQTYKNSERQWSNPSGCLLTVNAIDGTIIDRGLGY